MELLAPDVSRIAPDSDAAPDRVPDELAAGTPEPLRSDLERLVGAEQVLARAIDLVAYASDASPYRVMPKAVVLARSAGDVAELFAYGRRKGIPVTLRAGGTSLSGQAQGPGILVDVRRHWRGVTVEDGGNRARVRPGTLLGHANRVLARYGRKLGPDPASTDIATVGGVVANNSGGMRCGVTADSYSTVRALTFVLPSGTIIDTEAPGAEESFAGAEPELAKGLEEIRDRIRGDSELSARIRRKFEIKNTTGYRLCAFLDADTPLEIFRRLLVGSEGTLAFTAEAVFETVPLRPRTTTTWVHFESIDAACEPVPDLAAAGASAVELMVAPALMVAANSIPGTPEYWKELPPTSAALLVEFRTDDGGELDSLEAGAGLVLSERETIRGPEWSRDLETVELNWRVREGLHGLIGRLRPPGTALIIEDVCVPPARIAESAADIQGLLGEHGFLTGVAGHTSAGNLHFMLTPDFSKPEDLERYESFMAKLVDLIVDKYDGSLKAEHGTGVNMAPYVEREWGAEATELMWRIKALADPGGVLSPGVLLNTDHGVHLRNLKTTPEIEEVATNCVECGFCEPVCPSRDITLTPRQRIVVRREMARQPEGSPVTGALLDQYEYDGIQTCAADSACALACPLGIDTGTLVKGFRRAERDEKAERRGVRLAERWSSAERLARAGLRAGSATGGLLPRAATAGVRALLSDELVPGYPAGMPRAAPKLPQAGRDGAAAVYVPSCTNRIFGRARGAPRGPSLPEAMLAVSERAGVAVWIPDDVAGTCCAVPWGSKGLDDGHELMANRMVDAMWRWSDEGALPVVTDASSCALGLSAEVAPALTEVNLERHGEIEVLDSIAWLHDRVVPGLSVPAKLGSVAIHPTCSARHLGVTGKLEAVAAALADEVELPVSATCCGMAGDRGLLHPELTRSATADEAAELEGSDHDAYLSSNRTCEIGLQMGTGEAYESVVLALERATRPEG